METISRAYRDLMAARRLMGDVTAMMTRRAIAAIDIGDFDARAHGTSPFERQFND